MDLLEQFEKAERCDCGYDFENSRTSKIHQNVSLPAEESFFSVGNVSGNLEKPRFIRAGGETSEMNPSRCQFHEKQQIVSNQPVPGPSFDRREVHRCQHISMGFQECVGCKTAAVFFCCSI
jgi:hypothetical protein